MMKTTPTSNPSLQEHVRLAVERAMTKHRIPGMSIAITRADDLLFAGGFGKADLRNDTPARASTQYLWFSLTKIATATAAMRLVDDGKLDLDAPVSRFVSGYEAPATVRQLLSHTAGLANPIPIRWIRRADQPPPSPGAFLDALLARHAKPKYVVGGLAHYSNLGYLILAEVIAQAAARPFTEYLTDAVLRPLNMNHTGFDYPAAEDAAVGYVRIPRIATPLLRCVLPKKIVGGRAGRYTSLNPFLVKGAGYGGLVGDVTDAARLAAMHLADGGDVLRVDTARMMRTISSPGKPFDVGLGWFRKPTSSNTTVVEHLGAGGGFYNAMRLYPDLGLGIISMANTTAAYDHHALFEALAAEFR